MSIPSAPPFASPPAPNAPSPAQVTLAATCIVLVLLAGIISAVARSADDEASVAAGTAVTTTTATTLVAGQVPTPTTVPAVPKFTAPEGTWRAVMPCVAPDRSEEAVPFSTAKLVLHLCETLTGAVGVGAVDFPGASPSADQLPAFYDSVAQGAVSGAGATLVSQAPITLVGLPGRGVVTTVDGSTLHAWFVLRGTRMYQLISVGPGADPPPGVRHHRNDLRDAVAVPPTMRS